MQSLKPAGLPPERRRISAMNSIISVGVENAEWPAGKELLQRFAVQGNKPLELRQYLFLRRRGKRAAASAPAVAAKPASGTGASRPASAPAMGKPAVAPAKAPPAKKPWWKFW